MDNLELQQNILSIPCNFYHYDNKINNYRRVGAIFDTGCSLTSINVSALRKLLGASEITLANILRTNVNTNKNNTTDSKIANGDDCKCLNLTLHNIYLENILFKDMNVLVDCSKVLGNKDLPSLKRIIEETPPVALVGMDIINSFETVYMSQGFTRCYNLDMNKYKYFWEIQGKDRVDITNFNVTIQHAMANLLEEAGVSNYNDNMIDSIYNSLPNHFKESTEFDMEELRNCVNLYLKAIY